MFQSGAVDALASGTLSGFDVTGMEELMQEFMESPGLAECLSNSIDLADLMKLGESDHSNAEELLSPCLSEDQLDSIKSATEIQPELGGFGEIDTSAITRELMNNPGTIECLTSSMNLSSMMAMAGREPTEAEIELLSACFR